MSLIVENNGFRNVNNGSLASYDHGMLSLSRLLVDVYVPHFILAQVLLDKTRNWFFVKTVVAGAEEGLQSNAYLWNLMFLGNGAEIQISTYGR